MLFGGLVGAVVSIVLTYALFSGVELDGLLVMTGIFLCFLGTLLGARLASWVWHFTERNATPSPRP
jgi:predicted membrane channel-forming protein YqfA (hemolysin III family)